MTTKKVGVVVTGDASDAIKAFAATSAAADEAAQAAIEAGDRVAAAAVKSADTAAQGAARAAKTAAAESQAAADAFAEGNDAAYQRARTAAEKAASQAEAAWSRSAAASAKASAEAAAAIGTEQEQAAAKAAEAAKQSSAQAALQWEAAKKASSEAATLAERDASRFAGAFEGSAGKVGGIFGKLGGVMSSWGIPFGGAMQEMSKKFQEAEGGSQKFGTALQNVGKVATFAGIAGVAIIGTEAVKAAGNFQSATERLVTGAGESQQAIDKVRQGILGLAGQVGYGPQELANGLYKIESAGFHGAAGLNVLKAAAQGAKADGASLESTGDALTTVLTDMGKKAPPAADAMSMMVAAVGQGKMTMEEFASSIHSVLPNASAAGLSFAQVAGAVSTMTAQGISADQATQNLNHTIVKLQAPTASMIQQMASYGVNANDLTKNLGKNGLTGTMDILSQAILQHMGPAGETLRSAFNQSKAAAEDSQRMFTELPPQAQKLAQAYLDGTVGVKAFHQQSMKLAGTQGALAMQWFATQNAAHGFAQQLRSGKQDAQTFSAAMYSMLGDQTGLQVALHLTGDNMATFKNNVAAIGRAQADAKGNVKDWGEVQKNFNQQLDEAKSGVEALGVKLGMALIPKIQAVIKVVSEVVVWLSKHKAIAMTLAGVIGGVLVVAIGAYAIAMAQAAVATIAATWPILLIIAAVAAVVVGIVELATHWSEVWAFVKSVAEDVWHFLDGVWHAIDDSARTVWGAIEDFFVGLWRDIDSALRTAWGAVEQFFLTIWHAIDGALRTAWGAIEQFFVGLWHDIDSAIRTTWGAIETFFSNVWHGIDSAVRAIWNGLKSFLQLEWNGIKTVASTLWEGVKTVITGIWDDLKNGVEAVWTVLKKFLSDEWNGFATIGSTLWGAVVKGITTAWDGLSSGASKVWADVKGIFNDGVNGVIDVINVFIKALDVIPGVSIKTLDHVGASASKGAGAQTSIGTGGSQGGVKRFETGGVIPTGPGFKTGGATAIVGEGNPAHPEFVIPTDPKYRANAHGLLASLIGHVGMPMLQSGGHSSGGSWLDSVGGAISGAAGAVGGAVGGAVSDLSHLTGAALAAAAGPIISAAKAVADGALGAFPFPIKQLGQWGVNSLAGAASGLLASLAGSSGSGGGGGGGGGQGGAIPTGAHLSLIQQALGLAGQADTPGNESAVNLIVTHESGWNPNAINNWDSNAQAGDPSRGLMQTIMSTFQAYALPGYNTNIFDGLSNLIAGIRYAVSRYGSLGNVPGVRAVSGGGGYVGYDTGGVLRPGSTLAMNLTGHDEFVFTPDQVRAMAQIGVANGGAPGRAGGTPTVNFTREIVVQSDVSQQTLGKINALLDQHDQQLIRQLQGL